MKAPLFIVLTFFSFCGVAQNQPSTAPAIVAYGNPISLEEAKKIVGAAEAFALSKQWTVAIAIVDAGGNLVLLEKLDNTQIASIEVAIGKAKTANNFKTTNESNGRCNSRRRIGVTASSHSWCVSCGRWRTDFIKWKNSRRHRSFRYATNTR